MVIMKKEAKWLISKDRTLEAIKLLYKGGGNVKYFKKLRRLKKKLMDIENFHRHGLEYEEYINVTNKVKLSLIKLINVTANSTIQLAEAPTGIESPALLNQAKYPLLHKKMLHN